MAKRRGIMAQYVVREVREGDKSRLEMVIHGNQIIARGKWGPVGTRGNPDYIPLFDMTKTMVKGS